MNTSGDEHSSGELAEAERRQITVVYVDLVGSSRIAERLDPEDLVDLIVAYRQAATRVIEAHGGFIARLVGDGILAYWGYPRAREDDPRRAVRAALAIVVAMREVNRAQAAMGVELNVRIGIDSGVVVVGRLGMGGVAADVIGEAPNIAARVQEVAESDTVLVTETVRRLTDWEFEFVPRGATALKGLSESIAIYRVVAERQDSRGSRPTRATRIHGRESEQQTLDQCWRNVLNGRGQTVLIYGEPGMGKSTLVGHLHGAVTASNGIYLRTNCFPESVHAPLLPVRNLMRQAIGVDLLDDAGALWAKLDAITLREGLDPVEIRRALLPLLDPGASLGTLAELTASERKQRMFACIVDWLLAFARRTPVTLAIEDLHWADSSTLELLDVLMGRVAAARLCLVLTWRSGFETTWTDRTDVACISVVPLHRDAIEALIADMLRNDGIGADMLRAIVLKAEGNPLFAEELVQLVTQDHTRQASAEVLTLPSTLNDSLLARLDTVGELKPIAQVAAVIGREFDEQVLARVLDLTAAELAPKLRDLMASGLIVDDETGLRMSHAFKHALLRDVAYNSLLRARRRTIHAKTASVFLEHFPHVAEAQPEFIAHHLEEAGALSGAIDWWTKAGDRAGRQSATTEAVRLLERANLLFGRIPEETRSVRRAEVLNLLGSQYLAAQGNASPLVEQTFREAVAILEVEAEHSPALLFASLWGLHTHAMVRADMSRALDIGTRMLALAESEGDPDKVLQGHRLQGLAHLLTGEHDEARFHYFQVIERYDPIRHDSHRHLYASDPAAVVFAQLAWGEWISGEIATSEQHAQEGAARARTLDHPHSIVHAVGVDALRLLTAREFARSAEAAREARVWAEKHEFPYWIAWCDIILAACERAADPERSCSLLSAAIEHYLQTGARQLVPYALALEAECLLDAERSARAARLLDTALELIEETGVRLYEPEVLRLRACAASRLSEAEAGAYLQSCLATAHRQGCASFALRGLMTQVELAAANEKDAARRPLAAMLSRFAGQPETVDMRAARQMVA